MSFTGATDGNHQGGYHVSLRELAFPNHYFRYLMLNFHRGIQSQVYQYYPMYSKFDGILNCLNKKTLRWRCVYLFYLEKKVEEMYLAWNATTKRRPKIIDSIPWSIEMLDWEYVANSSSNKGNNNGSPFALNAPPVKTPKSDNTFPRILALWENSSTSACKLNRCWRWRCFFRFHLWCFIRGTFITDPKWCHEYHANNSINQFATYMTYSKWISCEGLTL